MSTLSARRGAPATLRRALAVLAALGLALATVVGFGNPADGAASKTALSLSVSKSSIAYDGSTTVTAKLTRGSSVLKWNTVQIQKRGTGTTKWLRVTSAKTDSKGRLVVKIRNLKRDTEVRAVFAGTARSAKSTSPKKKVSVAQEIEVVRTSGSQVPAQSPAQPAAEAPAVAAAQDTSLRHPAKKEIAMRLVSSAENSSTDWQSHHRYIEDIGDGRGYTAGIIGFCSGTGDMLQLVEYYDRIAPGNVLSPYLPALRRVNGTDSHEGLDGFVEAWQDAADNDHRFIEAASHMRDTLYFEPAVSQAIEDGLGPLGQFIYYDAMVMHGPGDDFFSFGGIRSAAKDEARTPAEGGSEAAYLEAFLGARDVVMGDPTDVHQDLSRTIAQRKFHAAGNRDLDLPLTWEMYGDGFSITSLD